MDNNNKRSTTPTSPASLISPTSPTSPTSPVEDAATNSSIPISSTPAAEMSRDHFDDIDLIFHGFKNEIDTLLAQLKVAANMRDDDLSKTLSMKLNFKHHLQMQRDLAGCRTFVEQYGKALAGGAKKVFAEDAAKWDGSSNGLEDGASESKTAAATETPVATDGALAGEQQRAPFKAMQAAERLGSLLDLLVRDLALLPQKDLLHRPTGEWSETSEAHWSEVLATRARGGWI